MSEIKTPQLVQEALKAAYVAKVKDPKKAEQLTRSKLSEWQIVMNMSTESVLYGAWRALGYDPIEKKMVEKGKKWK